MPRAVDDLDDAAVIADRVVVIAGRFGAHQCMIADAGNVARRCLARHVNADFRRRAVFGFVPFGGRGDQFAVGVAADDVGKHDRGQGAGPVQFLAVAFDQAFVGQFSQHALEDGAVGVLQSEGAGDFAGADIAGLIADERQERLPWREWAAGCGDEGPRICPLLAPLT